VLGVWVSHSTTLFLSILVLTAAQPKAQIQLLDLCCTVIQEDNIISAIAVHENRIGSTDIPGSSGHNAHEVGVHVGVHVPVCIQVLPYCMQLIGDLQRISGT